MYANITGHQNFKPMELGKFCPVYTPSHRIVQRGLHPTSHKKIGNLDPILQQAHVSSVIHDDLVLLGYHHFSYIRGSPGSLLGLHNILSLNGSTVFAHLSGMTIFFPWKPRPKGGIQTLALILCGLAACILLRLNPPQAEAKDNFPKGKASQTKEIITSNVGAIKTPNGDDKIPTVCFIGLNTTLVANQDVSPEVSTGPWPNLMTTAQEQENQVTNLGFLTNERTPGPGAILLPLNPSILITWCHIS
ncbi:hypothetical protein DSO57_1007520 [Entomophthora muscae]|uniref:Uncharacterized protein n=1 Tax=Entomophthora muscae TaxID=34485 RepID=A0ACC2UIB1_9FUNG|nr:hypothetical protein DSO57_1007520 [Entomophthora muscae]